jgi:hypothetical protein
VDEFKNNKEGETEELKVQPFPFFLPKFIELNGFPFACQHTKARNNTTKPGHEREVSTKRRADGNAGAWLVHV